MLDLILVATACLCFLLLALRRFLWGLTAILALLPAYQLRFTIIGVPSTLLELMLLLLFCVWIFRRWRQRGRSLFSLPWRWTMLLLLASALVAVFVAPDKASALGFWKAYFFEPMIFFLLLWDVVETERDVRTLLVALGGASLLLSLVALLQYLGFVPSPEPWISEAPKRVASLFEYPNALGLFLAPVVGFFAAFVLVPSDSKSHRHIEWFPLGVAVFGFLSLVFVVSRGGLIAVAAALCFVGFLSPYRKKLFLFLGVLALLVFALPSTRAVVINVVSGEDVSTDVRLVLWQGTARLLLDHPITGAGLGGFPALYDEYRLIKHTELLLYPHNIVLNAWVELGLAGLLLFCWLVLDAFRRGFLLLRNQLTTFGRQLVIGALTALVVIVVHGIVDVPYFKNDLALQFWFFLALLPIAGRFSSAGQKP